MNKNCPFDKTRGTMAKEKLDVIRKIRTFSGVYIDIFDPNPKHILIEDIANGLMQIPRFAGQLPLVNGISYSVLNHVINCFILAPLEEERAALLHEAFEAYTGDIPSPWKRFLPEYVAAEDRFLRVVAKKFGFTYPFNSPMKDIDRAMLEYEWNHIVLQKEGFPFPIRTMEEARDKFIDICRCVL